MNIYIDLHVDGASSQHGKIAHRWFSRNMVSLFSGVREEGVPWFASVVTDESGPTQRFEGDDDWDPFMEKLPWSPYAAQLVFFSDDVERGRLSSLPAGVAPEYRTFSASFEHGDADLTDPGFCSWLVDSFIGVAADANPAFGRIEYGQFSERANLDIALRRKPRQGSTASKYLSWRQESSFCSYGAWHEYLPGSNATQQDNKEFLPYHLTGLAQLPNGRANL